MSIDGTDFLILQAGAVIPGNAFASHKYAFKSALRYEIGVSILGGDLVWIQGPYPAGAFNDVKIFNNVFRHFSRLASASKLTTAMWAPPTR
jgi:hypothetical protein